MLQDALKALKDTCYRYCYWSVPCVGRCSTASWRDCGLGGHFKSGHRASTRPTAASIPEFFPAGRSSTALEPDFRISKAIIRSTIRRNWMDPRWEQWRRAGGHQMAHSRERIRRTNPGRLRVSCGRRWRGEAGSKRSQFGVERGGHLRCPNRAPERPSRGPETSPLGGNLKHFIFYCL